MKYDINTLSPYIRIAMDHTIQGGVCIPERVLFDYELLYVKEGEARITIAGTEYDARPGDVFLFRPKIPHSVTVPKNAFLRQPHIHFDLDYRKESPEVNVSFRPLDKIRQEEYPLFAPDNINCFCPKLPDYIHFSEPSGFEKRLYRVIGEFQNKVPFYRLAAKGQMINLLIFLFREVTYRRTHRVSSRLDALQRAKSDMDTNYASAITLDRLAREANISKFYFSRLFAEAFGLTPIRYLQTVRMEHAKELLRFTALPVGEIAVQVGYDSTSVFVRAFQKHTGRSPGRYRSAGEPVQ